MNREVDTSSMSPAEFAAYVVSSGPNGYESLTVCLGLQFPPNHPQHQQALELLHNFRNADRIEDAVIGFNPRGSLPTRNG